MSINHQYIELADRVYSRWIKSSYSVLSGTRANPHDLKVRVPFLLKTPEKVIRWEQESDSEGNTHLVVPKGRDPVIYEDEVIELYSADEDRIFRQLNRKLIEDGRLIPYHEERDLEISMVNALSDRDVLEIANSSNLPIFKKKIKPITSSVALDRIESKLTELGRKPSFKQALAEHRSNLA